MAQGAHPSMRYREGESMAALKIYALGFLFVAVVLCGVMLLLRYVKRVAPAPSPEGIDIESDEANKRFRLLDGRANGIFLLLTIVFGVAIYFALKLISQWRFSALPPAIMSFPITNIALMIPAMFGGMGLAAMVFGPVNRSYRPQDAAWYSLYLSNRRYGCDYDRLCFYLGAVVLVLASASVPALLNTYVQVRNDALVVHPFLGMSERIYALTDIDSIKTAPKFIAPNGRVRYDRDYVVYFKNGDKWEARDMPSGDAYDQQRVVEWLSQQSGVPIKEIPIFQTGDLYD
jgi:hypothetical protein